MTSLIHLSIGAVLLITLGAFFVHRTALARAKGYQEGRRDGGAVGVAGESGTALFSKDFSRTAWRDQPMKASPPSPEHSAALPVVASHAMFSSAPAPEAPRPNNDPLRPAGTPKPFGT